MIKRMGWASAGVALFVSLVSARAEARDVELVFILDSSGSVGASNWAATEAAVAQSVQNAAIFPQDGSMAVGVVQFATGAWIRYQFNAPQTSSAVATAVYGLKYTTGETYTKSAMSSTISLFDTQGAPGARRIALLVTDGNPNPPVAQNPCDLAATLDNRNIEVYVLGIGNGVTSGKLACLLAAPEDFVMLSYSGLASTMETLLLDLLVDSDGDGPVDRFDNCPSAANAEQWDCDADGVGDVCDPGAVDTDMDGVDDTCDNCASANPDQADGDGDGLGDACESP